MFELLYWWSGIVLIEDWNVLRSLAMISHPCGEKTTDREGKNGGNGVLDQMLPREPCTPVQLEKPQNDEHRDYDE
jgi:hypothetical protein